MKIVRLIVLAILALSISCFWATPALAIEEPAPMPTIANKWAWGGVLEPNDMLVIIYENTPYTNVPDIPYPQAFIWRFMSPDGTTELGQSLGYPYSDLGYGYNVIGFYFSPSDDIAWGQSYYLKLSGTPSAFTEPPEYTFQMSSGDYSTLTDQDDIEKDIEARILQIATDLENKWGLSADYSLVEPAEMGMVLSIYGEAFFRGALYGLQSYAPNAFHLVLSNIDQSLLTDRSWTEAYSTNLTSQFPGTGIETGMQAGNEILGVSYNLFGLLLTLGLIAFIVIVCLAIGGDWWGSIAGGVAPMVILARMGMFGLGELGLVAALCWLFFTAKMWKLI
jgi:hypothetical protein